jgi:hypothetical protein
VNTLPSAVVHGSWGQTLVKMVRGNQQKERCYESILQQKEISLAHIDKALFTLYRKWGSVLQDPAFIEFKATLPGSHGLFEHGNAHLFQYQCLRAFYARKKAQAHPPASAN